MGVEHPQHASPPPPPPPPHLPLIPQLPCYVSPAGADPGGQGAPKEFPRVGGWIFRWTPPPLFKFLDLPLPWLSVSGDTLLIHTSGVFTYLQSAGTYRVWMYHIRDVLSILFWAEHPVTDLFHQAEGIVGVHRQLLCNEIAPQTSGKELFHV